MDEIGLDDAYALKGPEDIKNLYRRWADTYESDFMVDHGYVYHHKVVDVFVAHCRIGPQEPILDVGCGTGVGGVELRRHGPWPIDGLDLSPDMLTRAAEKTDDSDTPVYRRLVEANVLEPDSLPRSDGGYGGLISIGAFTHGHIGPDAIDNLVPLVRAGGLLCLGVNEEFFAAAGFEDHLGRMVGEGTITDPVSVQIPMYDASVGDHDHVDSTALVLVFSSAES